MPRQMHFETMIATEGQKRLADVRHHFERAEAYYARAEAAVARNRDQLTLAHRSLQRCRQQLLTRDLRTIVQRRIACGRLPADSAPRIFGAPGIGGYCDACDQLLKPTQLVMSIPWPSCQTFAHLHSDCFMLWNAVRHTRAALARSA